MKAAVAVIFRDDNSRIKLLYIKRATNPHDPWSGHIAFPGGTYQKSDGDLFHTTIREVKEELCIDLEEDAVFIRKLELVRTIIKSFEIHPFLFKLRKNGSINICIPNDEVDEIYWIPIDELKIGLCRRFIKRINDVWTVYCYRWRNIKIWGATYRITRELIQNPWLFK